MTRVNADIDPSELKRPHLLAELRELTMVPASLKRSLKTKTTQEVLKNIPQNFTLNKGHVTFFYNKLTFLQKRFDKLCEEMIQRGYAPDYTRRKAFDGFDDLWYNDWIATEEDNNIVRQRIAQRITEKPHLYR